MPRIDGRLNNQLRPVRIIPGFQEFAEGSALIELGKTRVLCSVTIEDKVPNFMRGKGTGWITAEYSMLPRSTLTRSQRESVAGKVGGRSHEIQRLIGRSLRAVADLPSLGERTLIVDCDAIQADGGTRTAAVTGSYVALFQAARFLLKSEAIRNWPLKAAVAATSVGMVNGEVLLDLCYEEDSTAEADFNLVMTSRGEFVEVQGTAETRPFGRQTIDQVLALGQEGIRQLLEIQKAVIKSLES
ncbi:MAG: ribonuclease PH [Chloroflexi bacterium]|nr:ribonuclease PH [Chloroflexota bacterium]